MKVASRNLRKQADGEKRLPDGTPATCVVENHFLESRGVVAADMKYSNLCSYLQEQLIEDSRWWKFSRDSSEIKRDVHVRDIMPCPVVSFIA